MLPFAPSALVNEVMNAPDNKNDAFNASRTLSEDLQQRFTVLRDAAPLAIGIDKQIIEAIPDIQKKILRLCLRHHTQTTRYLKAMEKATVRFNLDGSEADAVTQEQRDHAAGLLRERFKKKAEQRRANEAAAKAEEARQVKLSQLAEKFGRKH